jgi:SAM-dependent methyltransferase
VVQGKPEDKRRLASPCRPAAAMKPRVQHEAGSPAVTIAGKLGSLARDAMALLTGRPPEVRNRVKFFLLSPIYDGFYCLVPVDPHREIARRLPPGTRRVLDLCTGTALVPAVVAAERETFVVGLDLSPEMLAMGRIKLARAGRTNAALVRGDAGRLPFADAGFDVVTVSFGLHELPTAVRERAVREVARVLRPGGVLVAADLDRPPWLGWLVDAYLWLGEPTHAREVTGDGLARLLRAAGFAVEREEPQGAMPMQVLIARRALAA